MLVVIAISSCWESQIGWCKMLAAEASRSMQVMYLRNTSYFCLVQRREERRECLTLRKPAFWQDYCCKESSLPGQAFWSLPKMQGRGTFKTQYVFKLPSPFFSSFFVANLEIIFYPWGTASSVWRANSTIIFVSRINSSPALLLLCTQKVWSLNEIRRVVEAWGRTWERRSCDSWSGWQRSVVRMRPLGDFFSGIPSVHRCSFT